MSRDLRRVAGPVEGVDYETEEHEGPTVLWDPYTHQTLGPFPTRRGAEELKLGMNGGGRLWVIPAHKYPPGKNPQQEVQS